MRGLIFPLLASTCCAALFAAGVILLPGCLPGAPHPADSVDLAQAKMMAPTGDMGLGNLDAPVQLNAHQLFEQAYTLIQFTCGPCHSVASGGIGPGFLAPASADNPDPYQTAANWPGFVNTVDPSQGLILTKGVHEGPALTTDQYNALLAWLVEEATERLRENPTPINPQVQPFYPVAAPALTVVQLSQISPEFTGAYISFVATTLPSGLGLEISNLRFFNTLPGAANGQQRAILLDHPLFIIWDGNNPMPDPVDNFSGTDVTIALNQNDVDPTTGQQIPGAGNLIVPGIATFTSFRPGDALSISFSGLSVVGATVPPDPCNAAGLMLFTTQLVPTYMRPANSCANITGMCHNSTTVAGSIDMSAVQNASADLTNLCQTLKFYNKGGIISSNMDPSKTGNHPFKLSNDTTVSGVTVQGGCTLIGQPQNCFTSFNALLTTWANEDM